MPAQNTPITRITSDADGKMNSINQSGQAISMELRSTDLVPVILNPESDKAKIIKELKFKKNQNYSRKFTEDQMACDSQGNVKQAKFGQVILTQEKGSFNTFVCNAPGSNKAISSPFTWEVQEFQSMDNHLIAIGNKYGQPIMGTIKVKSSDDGIDFNTSTQMERAIPYALEYHKILTLSAHPTSKVFVIWCMGGTIIKVIIDNKTGFQFNYHNLEFGKHRAKFNSRSIQFFQARPNGKYAVLMMRKGEILRVNVETMKWDVIGRPATDNKWRNKLNLNGEYIFRFALWNINDKLFELLNAGYVREKSKAQLVNVPMALVYLMQQFLFQKGKNIFIYIIGYMDYNLQINRRKTRLNNMNIISFGLLDGSGQKVSTMAGIKNELEMD